MTNRLDELQRLHDAATKGPWDSNWLMVDAGESEPGCLTGVAECFDAQDAELVAAMRNALPALLRVARAAQACLGGSAADGWHTPLREADVVELRAALDVPELRGTDG